MAHHASAATLLMLSAALAACGGDKAKGPVPWRGEAVNSLLGDDDAGGDDVDGDNDDAPDACRLDAGGCDNSGGDDDTPTPEPDPTTPEPEPEPTSPDPDGWDPAWIALEDEMLRLVNEFREAGGSCPSGSFGPRGPLRMDPALRTAARLHSEDMANNGYFSHTGQDGSSPWSRIGEAGYTAQPTGENIAAGNRTAQSTFDQWRTSDGHCRNMISTNSNEIGIGYAPGGGYGHYWTQTFGAR